MKTLKHFLLVLFTLSITSFTLFAKDDYVSKEVKISKFNALELSSAFHVTFEKSDNYSLQITVPEKYVDDVVAKVEYNTLILKIDPKILRKIRSGYQFTAVITAPSFNDLDVSGAVVINFIGEFETENADFEFSGASRISGLNIKAKKMEIDICGATRFDTSHLIADKLSMDVSGASHCGIDITSGEADIDLSGASKSRFAIFADYLKLNTSGASKCVINALNENAGSRFDLDLTGASKVDAEEVKYDVIHADLSGASLAKVSPVKKLFINASGASVLGYVKSSNLEMDIDISGSSSVKHL